MKPIKLVMQAFGPYAEREEIDFRTLGSRTMFVISGKTGSGKTTIFDGISYAIYGKASGEDRSPTELRSQFANEEAVTEVELTFSLRGRTYRIWRSPQQDKKKARGEGFTTINARSELYMFDDQGSELLLGANVRDVDEKVKEIIQLDANQFRQILMIPQGEFRKLLTSDSKDKEIILQRLFHTEFYKVIQENLKSEADELKKRLELSVQERTRELLRIHFEENEDLKTLLLENPLNDLQILQILPSHIESMELREKKLEIKYQRIQEKRDNLKTQLVEAKALVDQFDLKTKLIVEKEELEKLKPEIDRTNQEILLAQRASLLVQQDEYCHKLNKKLNELKDQLEENVKDKDTLAHRLQEAKKHLEEETNKESLRNSTMKKHNQLEDIEKDVNSLDLLQTESSEIEKKQHSQQQLVNTQSEKISFLQEGIKNREARIEKLDNSQSKLFHLEKSLQDKNSFLDLLEQVQGYELRIEESNNYNNQLKSQNAHLSNQLKDASDTLKFLEGKWNSAQAAILARGLEENESCPVCGSTHHPQLAVEGDELPSEEDMKTAKNNQEEVEKKVTQLTILLAQEDTKLTGLHEQVQSILGKARKFKEDLVLKDVSAVISELKQGIQLTNKEIVQTQDEFDQLQVMKEEVKKGKVKLEELEASNKTNQQTLQKLQSEFLTKHTTLEKIKEGIPEELRSKEKFYKELSDTKKAIEVLKDSLEKAQKQYYELENAYSVKQSQEKDKREQVENLKVEMQKEREEFLALLSEQGFLHYKSFLDSKKTEEEINFLQEKVKKHGEDMRSVSDRLSDIERLLEKKERPNLLKIEEQITHVTNDLKDANDAFNKIVTNTKENKVILSKVNEINQGIKELENTYLMVGHLAEVARGQNANRVTFERYVLASFLEDILHIANERLIKMTSGRYQLIRKTERSKGNVQSGLELLVFDQYTGQERHVKTLSGGESFKASLALALGLADVVQQYAGGVSLETMFIDEGFGTLDPESLDHAIEALMDIQSSGRLVGLISHVPELKERIDARLEVISSQNGSRTEFQILA